jgi:hypothetical protein
LSELGEGSDRFVPSQFSQVLLELTGESDVSAARLCLEIDLAVGRPSTPVGVMMAMGPRRGS